MIEFIEKNAPCPGFTKLIFWDEKESLIFPGGQAKASLIFFPYSPLIYDTIPYMVNNEKSWIFVLDIYS